MAKDLHELPKLRDSLSYLYVEHCKIEQDGKSVACFDLSGKLLIPCASLAVLMLGPGTSISHEAVKTLTVNGCNLIWTGEEGVRYYAQGMGETRKANRLIHQATMVSDPQKRLEVVKRMYMMRFDDDISNEKVSVKELRGREGVRVRKAYVKASKKYDIPWHGRSYKRDKWNDTDDVNKALSCANSCLYGICHTAIVSVGYSPGLGFIHHGKQLSFVFDIADLYKFDISIPVAFEVAAQREKKIEKQVRYTLRERFKETKLLKRIIPDIDMVLGFDMFDKEIELDYDTDGALPGPLWDGKEN